MNSTPQTPRRNGTLWLGILFVVLAVASFFLFFVPIAGQQALPWVNLILAALAFVLVVLGLKRAITQPQLYRGKVAGWVFAVVSTLLLGLTAFAFYGARHLPGPNDAPAVGQKAPDFELKNTTGHTVSLAQLLTEPAGSGQSGPPKAVLLVFYRGYW